MVFFGACAGVSKDPTPCCRRPSAYALRGWTVLVGVVKPGRSETAALLDGLTLLPQKRIQHRGQLVHEFDLDAALAVSPGAGVDG